MLSFFQGYTREQQIEHTNKLFGADAETQAHRTNGEECVDWLLALAKSDPKRYDAMVPMFKGHWQRMLAAKKEELQEESKCEVELEHEHELEPVALPKQDAGRAPSSIANWVTIYNL